MLLNKEKVELALENTTILWKKNKIESEFKEATSRLKELEVMSWWQNSQGSFRGLAESIPQQIIAVWVARGKPTHF